MLTLNFFSVKIALLEQTCYKSKKKKNFTVLIKINMYFYIKITKRVLYTRNIN